MTNDEGMTKPEATLRQLRLNRFNGFGVAEPIVINSSFDIRASSFY
jgi:hypothetical protein